MNAFIAKFFRTIGFVLVTVMIAFSPSATAGIKVQTFKSPGGLDIWFVEQRGLPIVNIAAAFRGGRSLEPKGKEGLAKLMSYLFDEGAGNMKSQDFMAALADRAINFGVSSDTESFGVSLSFVTEHKDEALRLAALALTKPRFDADAVRRMKDAMLVEQAQAEDDPQSKADLVWWQTAYPGAPYGISGGGTPLSVKGMTVADLRAFHAKALAKANLLIVIVGDLSAKDAGLAADTMFGGLPTGEIYKFQPDVQLASPATKIIDRNVPQSVIAFGMPALKRSHPDFRALHTLNYVLGGGSFASRLMQEIRVKRGLVYGVSSSVTTLNRTGIVNGVLATKNETAGEALTVLKAEIARMRDSGISAQELADAKAYLTGAWPLVFDSNSSITSRLLSFRLDGLPSDYGDKRNAEILALTETQMKRVAKTYLDPNRMLTIIVGKPVGITAK